MPTRFDVAKGDVKICGAIVTVNAGTGQARDITRVQVDAPDPAEQG